jgi:phosphohistidine phosphatase
MKRLYLMRHGHAPSPSEAGVAGDALRPLSERGRRDVARMAAELARRGARPTKILHSPLVRAAQTAAAAAEVLKPRGGAQSFKPLDNTMAAQGVLDALKNAAADQDEILAVGHQPQLGELASLLAGEPYEIRPAGVVAIDLEGEPRGAWSLNADDLE